MTVVTDDPAANATASAATTTAPVPGAPPVVLQPGAATTATSQSTGAEATSSNSFDAASIEEAFGLPAGTLKDVKDNDSALSAVREYTDKLTVAGIGVESPLGKPAEAPAAKQAGQPAAPPAEGDKPQYLTKADIDKLFADRDKAQQTQQTGAMLTELDRRLEAEINSWASPKYGVGKQRTFKQVKAFNDLKDMIVTHIAGAATTGQQLPIGEVLARRVRLLDDETYKPTVAGAAAVPLGTPGAAKAVTDANKDGPRNIHEAVMKRKI